VDNAAIGTAAVGSDELGAASVIAGKIAAGGVSATNQYTDATITDAKFVSRIAKGFLARFTSTSSDSAHGPGGNTDMTVTVALTAGRTYWIHLHSQVLFGSIVGAYAIELDHDAATVGRFWRGDLGSSETIFCDSWIEYTPGASDASAVLTVQNGTSSAGNMTVQGGAANVRVLSVYDAGTI
jgi:hypothetical protein